MAEWKRLTRQGGFPIDVNMDQVMWMGRGSFKVSYDKPQADLTRIVFLADRDLAPNDAMMSWTGILYVKETPDEIHALPNLSSKSSVS